MKPIAPINLQTDHAGPVGNSFLYVAGRADIAAADMTTLRMTMAMALRER